MAKGGNQKDPALRLSASQLRDAATKAGVDVSGVPDEKLVGVLEGAEAADPTLRARLDAVVHQVLQTIQPTAVTNSNPAPTSAQPLVDTRTVVAVPRRNSIAGIARNTDIQSETWFPRSTKY